MTVVSAATPVPEPADYLATLLRLGQLLNSSLELKDVLETAIEQVISFVGAERGFILLVDIETGRVWGEALRNIEKAALESTLAGSDTNNTAEISRTIVESVLDTRNPLVCHNAMEDPRFAGSPSVQFSRLRSVLCVPLISHSRLLGVIYLDNRVQTGIFAEKHLDVLMAFANLASGAIENARLYDNLRRSLDDRLRLQDELHKQQTRRLALEEASRLKSEFIGFVAHELRNPLTTIRGYVQTLLMDSDHTLEETLKTEFYEAIEADSDRLLDMINELLDVSRLEAGRQLTLHAREIQLRPLLEKLARRHRFYQYFTRNHQIVTTYSHDFPDTIVADEDKLNQILSNLLSNAIKYSPEGGQITVSGERDDDGSILIRVKDSGIGMSPEEQSRLFRRYERLERAQTKGIPGTGLGLYLARNLVELHGGEITCQSERGHGSIFTVRMPAYPTNVTEELG